MAAIAADRPAGEGGATLVGLGDYIDRGPDSRRVIERLIENPLGLTTVCLRGNHEKMLVDFMERPAEKGPVWLRYGAESTLLSYGVDFPLSVSRLTPADYQALRDRLAETMPAAHLEFLRHLPTSATIGDFFFVHAGARPGRPLGDQREEDLLWIREGFADRDEPFEKVIVHGHTPVDQAYLGKHRINLDTGGYASDRLSVLVLEGGERRLLSV
jgi:serine/threonine protein phosphatase 1